MRQEKVSAAEAGFLDAVERVYFSDACRNTTTAIFDSTGTLTGSVDRHQIRLSLAIAAVQDARQP